MTHRMSNLLQSALLLLVLAAQAAAVGWLVGGVLGAWLAILLGLALAAGAQRITSWSALRALRARPLDPRTTPGLHAAVRTLSTRAGLTRMPLLALIDTEVPNAVTVGSPRDPLIGLSRGLLRQLPDRELVGVLAHEISHIAHGDLRMLALARAYTQVTHAAGRLGLPLAVIGALLGSTQMMTVAMVLLFGSPLATLLMLALSRQREFAADGLAARLTRDPAGLAGALRRIEGLVRRWSGPMRWAAQGQAPSWLQTHPGTTQRVDRLRRLAVPA
ncbi:MAG: M48 family metalloprotease [Myxococcales bacterium]|nr:M48 family metalloprotease [Myxococcales bacterium]